MQEDYGQWFARGRAHQKAGRPIDAIVCYRRALRSNRHAVQAQYRLGEALRDIGRPEEARRAWHAGLALAPDHGGMLLCAAEAARQAGAFGEARDAYGRILAARPGNPEALVGDTLSRIGLGEEAAYAEFGRILAKGETAPRWDALARALAAAPPSAARHELLQQLVTRRGAELPPRLLALAAQALSVGGARDQARAALVQAEALIPTIDDPEILRGLALAAARLGTPKPWAESYAHYCTALFASATSVRWPRRTAGAALRVIYLLDPGAPIDVGGVAIDPQRYLATVIAGHARDRVAAAVCLVGSASPPGPDWGLPGELPLSILGPTPAPESARALGETDADAVIDLVGLNAAIGPLLAQGPARSAWTYAALVGANVAPLITHALPQPEAGDDAALSRHRFALEAALQDGCAGEGWLAEVTTRTAPELSARWRAAVAAHQAGDAEAAQSAYRELLAEQPGYAPAQHLLGALLRERGEMRDAAAAFKAALAVAPGYVEPRTALASLWRDNGLAAQAAELCQQGLSLTPNDASLWRALGLARLSQYDGAAASQAFRRGLEIEPDDATTHYNLGVALQMLHRLDPALRAYQRALALNPKLYAADFNIGVIFREQGQQEAAIRAFETVLAHEPRHVPAHKALAETLLRARHLGAWFKAFDRFEAMCPDALPLAVLALEACQYRADFASLDRYLERVRQDRFKAGSEAELADCLEELLFLLLYFDGEPDLQFSLYQAYDLAAKRVYGEPLSLPEARRPGRIRVGYISADLRNHVMGKMMWSAVQHHDRDRFEIFFYSLSTANDAWTERFRGLADHFEVIAGSSQREAVERIAADELDLLVDLGTNSFGAKPGILARKPARVQVTHVATAGVVGLSAIDYKLTDAFADLPENQAFQLETLLPMAGCVYPYRHVPPAAEHPYRRETLGIAPDQVLIGAFVNPLKLSRRCLALWREVLERIPKAMLALSPNSAELREVYGRLLSAAGIALSRICVLPQGRDDAENQARYTLIDFTLDPMPYGAVNGTLEALDMNVPVVTLVGRRHGERCGYSILTNLGVPQTIAASGSDYVAIAVRLANDAAFKAEVKAAIAAGITRSPLTDMPAHTRHLEQAYLQALERSYPAALSAARDG